MRFDKSHAKQVAKDFMTSSNAKIWQFVDDEIRNALIDQTVMGCVRMANAVAADNPFRPGELLAFRKEVVRILHDGISMGSAGRRFMRLNDPDPDYATGAHAIHTPATPE
jgi:hypothetical protein